MSLRTVLFFLTLFLYFVCVDGKVKFLSDQRLNETTYTSPYFQFVGKQPPFDLTGKVIKADPLKGCDDFQNNVTDFFVVIRLGSCSPESKAYRAYKAGAKLVLFMLGEEDNLGDAAGTQNRYKHKINIPILEFQPSNDDRKLIEEALDDPTKEFIINITPDENPNKNSGLYIAFSVIFITFGLILIGLASYKYYGFFKHQGFQPNVAQWCLIIEILANIERIIVCLEPNEGIARGILGHMEFSILFTLSFPWSLVSTLLVSLYWHQALKGYSQKSTVKVNVLSLDKLRIPFIILSIIIIGLDLSASISRGYYLDASWLDTVNGIFYALVVLAIAIFFLITGFRILHFLKGSSSKRATAVQRMSLMVALSGIGMIVFIIGTAVAFVNFDTSVFLIFAGIDLISITQILVFKTPSEKGSGSSDPNTKTSTKKEPLEDVKVSVSYSDVPTST